MKNRRCDFGGAILIAALCVAVVWPNTDAGREQDRAERSAGTSRRPGVTLERIPVSVTSRNSNRKRTCAGAGAVPLQPRLSSMVEFSPAELQKTEADCLGHSGAISVRIHAAHAEVPTGILSREAARTRSLSLRSGQPTRRKHFDARIEKLILELSSPHWASPAESVEVAHCGSSLRPAPPPCTRRTNLASSGRLARCVFRALREPLRRA